MEPAEIHAVMLAAGTGRRLKNSAQKRLPKCLLKFDRKSLLQRHIEALTEAGVKSLTIIVGFKSHEISREIRNIGANDFVNCVYNDRFEKGSVVSLWCASENLRSGHSILFMDADILYHPILIKKLTAKSNQSIIPYDTEFELGEEPVKVCFQNKRPVEFGKLVDCHYDKIGEWPGLILLLPNVANLIADELDKRILKEDIDCPYEDAMREAILGPSRENFNFLDITGIPWIEIDFPEDIKIASSKTLPAIKSFSG